MLNRECEVLEPFCLAWYQRVVVLFINIKSVLEPFCLAWYQRESIRNNKKLFALEPFYLIWDQRIVKTLLFETKDFGIIVQKVLQ